MSGSLWSEIEELTSGAPIGTFRISFNSATGETSRVCLNCDKAFPQTDSGFADLNTHEFEEHGRTQSFDWHDLHGKDVTIYVVERIEKGSSWDKRQRTRIELVARDADGVVYFLGDTGYDYGDEWQPHKRGFKWHPKHESNLQRLMPGVPVSPSSDSERGDESHEPATATRRAAKAG